MSLALPPISLQQPYEILGPLFGSFIVQMSEVITAAQDEMATFSKVRP
jgi:hypothetical protein